MKVLLSPFSLMIDLVQIQQQQKIDEVIRVSLLAATILVPVTL